MDQKWPQEIWLVRHGQSAGNVARDAAEAAAGLRVDIAERDVDVPLSELGMRQSQALGAWFAALPAHASRTSCCIRPMCARPRPPTS
jgi:broad specificity phosphatase PhoE